VRKRETERGGKREGQKKCACVREREWESVRERKRGREGGRERAREKTKEREKESERERARERARESENETRERAMAGKRERETSEITVYHSNVT